MQFLFLSVFRKFPTFHIDSYFHFRKIIFSHRSNSFFQKKRFWLLTKANGQLLMRFGGGGGEGGKRCVLFQQYSNYSFFFMRNRSHATLLLAMRLTLVFHGFHNDHAYCICKLFTQASTIILFQ